MNPIEAMPNPRTCPACGAPLHANSAQGLCPVCLMKAGLSTQPSSEETVASGSKPGGTGPAAIQTEISRLFPQLEILALLGQGGMGMVYKARQPQLDRIVALKVMRADLSRDPAFAERFAREARALAKLNHPNIVSVFDFGQSGGHCWILMEFVDGTNLRELLRTKTLAPREALGIVPKVCDALQYAHDEGIVHRDIKPENILLDKKGRVKIADFGLAKLVGKDASEFSLTATGMTLGTPRYMAPEQFDKPQEVDHRADIYSLGVVLYEMLTGEVPMGRFSLPSATIGVDVRLDEIVLRTLEKEPSRRYQHVSEVKSQVEGVASKPVAAASSSPLGSPVPKTERQAEDTRGFLRRLADESVVGKAAIVTAIAAIFAHKLQWQSLIVPGNQVLSPANSLVINCKVSVLMLALAIGASLFAVLPGLTVLAGRVVRVLVIIFAVAALAYQFSFFSTLGKWEPGQEGKVLRMTQSYAEFGFYATMVLTALGVLLFVLRLFEENRNPTSKVKTQVESVTGVTPTAGPPLAQRPALGQDGSSDEEELESGWFVSYAFIGVVSSMGAGLVVKLVQDAFPPRFEHRGTEIWGVSFAALLLFSIGIYRQFFLRRNKADASQSTRESKPLDHRLSEALTVGLPGWFNRRATWMQKLIQAALTVTVAFATLVFLGFNIHSNTDVTAGQVSNSGTVQVGQPSPWLTVDFSSTNHSFAIHWFSASLWIGFAGLALGCLSERLRRSVPDFDEAKDRRKRQVLLVVMVVVLVLYLAGLVVNGLIMSGATSKAARGVTERALGTKSAVSMNPYTFAGLPAPFVKGAQGPELSVQFVKQMGFTPLQVVELNKTFQSYYRQFLSLERQHTELSRNAQGHVIVKIAAFPDESLALAQRMAQELRGLVGKEVIPAPQPGMLMNIGLFRHAGEASVTAELWKENGIYFFKEERIGAPNAAHLNDGVPSGRSTSGDKLIEVIPEEYRVYWKE